MMRACLVAALSCAMLAPAAPGVGAAMDRAAAIADPLVLAALDSGGLHPGIPPEKSLSLARMLGAAGVLNADVFALPPMAPLRAALDREFDDYAARQSTEGAAATRLRVFDRTALYAPGTRFVLSGIVNRMDRAYKAPAACGEIRLIYRPVADSIVSNGKSAGARLPVTLNLVLNAKTAGDSINCGELARRWLAASTAPPQSLRPELLTASGGALEFVTPGHVDRIEINIQIARAVDNPDDVDGRADYLMKVFRRDTLSRRFVESAMENQIAFDRLRTDPALASDFRSWLSMDENLTALDRGTLIVPERFLDTRAITVTPQSAARGVEETLPDTDRIALFAAITLRGMTTENILSPAGLARRLDDITCSGCHRTRAIGGFHFLGTERANTDGNAVLTPASPHFIGDQPRRLDILAAIRDGKPPDFSRGFSARPQARRSAELDGTTFLNGWGAHCHAPTVAAPKPDASFASWTCIEGLQCQIPAAAQASRAGFCFPPN